MIDPRVKNALRPVGRRVRMLRLSQWTFLAWTVAAVFGLLLWHQRNTDPSAPPVTGWQVLIIGGIGTFVAVLVAVASGWNVHSLARRVEAAFPQLKQRLLTALSQRPDDSGRLGYLQQVVLNETLVHARTHPWQKAIPDGKLAGMVLATIPAAALAFFVAFQLGWARPGALAEAASGAAGPLIRDGEVLVEPGDTEVERGRGLVVTARFGLRVPREATLLVTSDEGEQRIPMKRSLDDPLFAAQLEQVDQPVAYQVESRVATSETYRIEVFEFPALQRADAHLQYPRYADLPDKVVEDTLRVTAPEGTDLTWVCQLNKDVARAWLESDGNAGEEVLELVADGETDGLYRIALKLLETQRWTLQLEDAQGRRNKLPPRLVARVLPNQPPELKLASARDVRVSPLEEFPIEATVQDDFGIVRAGLGYSIPGKAEKEVLLGESIGRIASQPLIHQIDFEALEAEPDELLSYYFWAEDVGPDGEVRRTRGDMFFAEVRPFEEIFREGQSPPGGAQQQQNQGSQQAQDAQKLAELQKQVVVAIWALVRREDAEQGSEALSDDVGTVSEAQTTAKEMLAELAAELQDAQSVAFAEDADARMQEVLDHLTQAQQSGETASIHDALSSSQLAYQALLRLRDREFQVVRSQQSQSSSSSSSASRQQMQQQLDQLELKNDQNRYEAEQQAQEAEENPLQQEMRQVLSRLGELARRQQDLNKQIQQLQSALQAAETEEEKEEIQRLLKRLREQQEELLRDTDELSQRMQDSARQSEAVREAQQQLEQTRENVRQAAESLGEQDASQALSAGTRAERQFDEMRDSVRQETSGQFDETMRQMREQARELETQQEQLSEQIRKEEAEPNVAEGLRGSPQREQVKEAMAEQSERLKDLLEQMQETIKQSEEIEPLLAENLYDSFRQAQRDQTERRLDFTAELLERGLTPQAIEMEEGARRGIERLREGVEDAAESVIGDETEALRRASARLDRLAEAVNQEIRDATGQPSPTSGSSPHNSQDGNAQDARSPREAGSKPADSPTGQVGQPGDQTNGEQDESSPNQQRGGSQGEGEPREGQPPEGQQQPEGQAPDEQPRSGAPGDPRSNAQDASESPSQDPSQPGPSQPSPSQPSPSQPGPSPSGQPQPGSSPSDLNQPGGSPAGQPASGQQSSPDQQSSSAQPSSGQPSSRPNRSRLGGERQRDGGGSLLDEGSWVDSDGGAPFTGPITGEGFREWSDAMRDVEQLIEDPELRSDAARIRERARDMRREWNRHSSEPQWPLVTEMIAAPLERLRMQVSEELIRRSAEKNAVVPIDRDPVPEGFDEAVRDYYERIGSGR